VGDSRRFSLMADLVRKYVPDRKIVIGDVAGGGGGLQAALRGLGYRNVLSIDRRRKYASGRSGYRYGLFSYKYSDTFGLVVGMHPDEATDHIVLYGQERNIPWIVCPCCVRPSAVPYGDGRNDYHRWIAHLRALGGGPAKVETVNLPMAGRRIVLLGGLEFEGAGTPGVARGRGL
jgi:hypothetical protein